MNSSSAIGLASLPKSIAILSAASLAWNPRVFKEGTSLARAGFHVTVYGVQEDALGLRRDEQLARDHGFVFKSVAPEPSTGLIAAARRLWGRLRYRLGRELGRVIGFDNFWQTGLYAPELYKHVRRAHPEYVILHLEAALLLGTRLMDRGFRVGLDMEDWYSEDLLPEAKRGRPIAMLREAERKLLTNAAHVTCPSRAMSQALAAEYSCSRMPSVIYNSFALRDRQSIDGKLKDRTTTMRPSIFWFSQTLGPGRGVEDLLAAMPLLKRDAEVHLRGNPMAGCEAWLASSVPEALRERLFVHALVPMEELPSRVAEHDIGFAGEMLYSRSRDLTVTNKVLQYLLGGLAVVASCTAGQREIAEQAAGAVLLYPGGDAKALAGCINALLLEPAKLESAKAAAVEAARQRFCWEREEQKLVDLVRRAVRPTARNS